VAKLLSRVIARARAARTREQINPPAPLIQSSGITQKLIAAFNIKGKSITPTLGDILQPVVIVEDLVRSSWFNQATERPAGGGVLTFAPTAGEFGSVQIFNPVGSGVKIIVDTVFVAIGTGATAFALRQSSTALPTLVALASNWRDPTVLVGAPATEIRTNTSAGASGGSIVGAGVMPVNQSLPYNIAGIYGPGQGLTVASQTVTNALTVGFLWRERFLEQE